MWVPRGVGDQHFAALHMHENKLGVPFESAECEHILGEKIARPDCRCMAFEELIPHGFSSVGCGLDAVLLED